MRPERDYSAADVSCMPACLPANEEPCCVRLSYRCSSKVLFVQINKTFGNECRKSLKSIVI